MATAYFTLINLELCINFYKYFFKKKVVKCKHFCLTLYNNGMVYIVYVQPLFNNFENYI